MTINASLWIFILSILLIILTVLCLYHSSEYKNHLEYPSIETILSSEYPLNQMVYIKGSIIEINSDGYYILDIYNGQQVTFKVSGKSPAGLNDEVSILGVLGPSNQILSVKKIRTINYWKYKFLLLRSFLAMIFLLILFLHYWQLDFKKLTFKRR